MSATRRTLFAAGLACAVATLVPPAVPAAIAAGPEADVEAAADALTRAMLAADGPALDALVLDGLSYGHSGGVVQDKAAFIDELVSRRSSFPSITLTKRSASVVGDDAIARHVFDGEVISNGKTAPVHIGVMQVWHRDQGRWRLLARQAYKL